MHVLIILVLLALDQGKFKLIFCLMWTRVHWYKWHVCSARLKCSDININFKCIIPLYNIKIYSFLMKMEKGMKDIPELSISCNKNITCTTILELRVGSRCKSCLQTSYFFNEQANLKRCYFYILRKSYYFYEKYCSLVKGNKSVMIHIWKTKNQDYSLFLILTR